MRDGCSPAVFYAEIRHLLAGFDRPIALRDAAGGVFARVTLRGASGAQSPLLPCIDAFLGIGHAGKDEMPEYAPTAVHHMPLAHRGLLRDLRSAPPAAAGAIRALAAAVRKTDAAAAASLEGAHDACIAALGEFRKAHLALVRSFIVRPAVKVPALAKLDGDHRDHLMQQHHHHQEQQQRSLTDSPLLATTPSTASATESESDDDGEGGDSGAGGPHNEAYPIGKGVGLVASAAAAAERARGAPLKFAGASTTIALEELRGTGGSSMLAFLRGRLDDTRLARPPDRHPPPVYSGRLAKRMSTVATAYL